MNPTRHRPRGVTLLELAIVLLIMGILAMTAFGYYANTRDQAKRAKALEDMNTIRAAVKRFRADPYNTSHRRPANPRELVSVTFDGTETKMVQTASGVVEQEQPVTAKRHFLDALPKTPWGLDYNIDLYHVVAWNTDRRVTQIGPVWGERLTLPYTNVNTEEFDAPPAPAAWTFSTSGGATWHWATGAVALASPGAAEAVYALLNKEILVKGLRKEVEPAPGDEETRLMNVDWGCVIECVFDYEQDRGGGVDTSIDDDATTPEAQERLAATLADHAIDFDPAVLEREMVGAILLWPKSKTPLAPGTPYDGDMAPLFGVRFSDRRWEILPPARVLIPNLPPEGSTGEWAGGRHSVKFISKYDELHECYLLDVTIDGDLKYSIKLPPTAEDHFRLTISPDHFTDPARAIASEMLLQSVTVSGFDFSKHYTDTLWREAKTFGR